MLRMTIMVCCVFFVNGDLKDAISTLGWKRISLVTSNSESWVRDLARNGVHVATPHDPCQVTKDLNATFDGTVTDLRLFNESLLQRTLECGMS